MKIKQLFFKETKMIKLKNLWKIALATMTMSAMLVACDTESSDNGKKNDDSGLGLTGVYSYTVNRNDIAAAWRGSVDSPIFSVMFLDETALEIVKKEGDLKKNPYSHPEYQIGAFGNMRIADKIEEGNFAVYGMKAVDNVYKYYDGVAVTITDTELKVFVDTAKLVKTQLRATFKNEGNGDEADMTDKHSVDLKGYKPYVIALASQANDPDNYVASGFNADLMKMEEGATFPAGDLKKAASVVLTAKDINSVKGSVTDSWAIIDLAADGSFEFTYDKDTMEEIRFIYTVKKDDGSDAGKNFKVQGSECKALDTDVAIKDDEGDDTHCQFATSLFTDDTTYVVTLNKENSTCKVSEKK